MYTNILKCVFGVKCLNLIETFKINCHWFVWIFCYIALKYTTDFDMAANENGFEAINESTILLIFYILISADGKSTVYNDWTSILVYTIYVCIIIIVARWLRVKVV